MAALSPHALLLLLAAIAVQVLAIFLLPLSRGPHCCGPRSA